MVGSHQLFDLGISARMAAREADVSYPAALNAFDCIRYAILYHLAEADKQLKGEIETDEAYFGGKREIATGMTKTRQLFLEYWRDRERFQ